MASTTSSLCIGIGQLEVFDCEQQQEMVNLQEHLSGPPLVLLASLNPEFFLTVHSNGRNDFPTMAAAP